MEKILILGGSSRLARHFTKIYSSIAIPISQNECDISVKDDLIKAFNKYSFKYVLNCAAVTDIDYAEKNPETTELVNYKSPKIIKSLCLERGKKAIFISSNYAVNPINVYGKTKKKLEKLAGKNCLIIRTDFYDGENFIIKNLLLGNKTGCYSNAFFNPVSIDTLSREIWKYRDYSGILNIFSDKCLSYYDFALIAEKKLKTKKGLIFKTLLKNPLRPLNACGKSDISIKLPQDLSEYANYIKN